MCQKVSLIPSALCVPTASFRLPPRGLPSAAPSLRSAVSQRLQRQGPHCNIFHGFIPSKHRPHLPTSHGCLLLRHPLTPDTNAAEGQSAGLPSPHLSNRLKGVSNQRFKVRNRYTARLLSPTPPLPTAAAPWCNPATETGPRQQTLPSPNRDFLPNTIIRMKGGKL